MITEPSLDRPVVLVVDDTPDNLKLMSGLLKDRYRLKVANGGERALAIARSEPPPDLILFDIMDAWYGRVRSVPAPQRGTLHARHSSDLLDRQDRFCG